MYEALDTFPPDTDRLWLRVFEGNPRARRFWEKHGWQPTGRSSRTSYPPHPVLLQYELDLACAHGAEGKAD